MDKQIQEIFRDILDDTSLVITRETFFHEIKDWDSVMLIDVLIAVENEFSIKLNIEDAQGVGNVSDIFKLIESKNNQ